MFFTTLVGTIVGLRACDRSSVDLIRALGGGRMAVLRRVRVRAALPDYFAALKISAPAAVLGAIIGEFIGGSENGLGVALIAARANADSARVWGVALVATAVAGLGYALIAFVGRLLTPWARSPFRQGCGVVSALIDLTDRRHPPSRQEAARRASTSDRPVPAGRSRRRLGMGRAPLRSGPSCSSPRCCSGCGSGSSRCSTSTATSGRRPARCGTGSPTPWPAQERRDELWEATRETLVESGLGFLTGLAAAVVVAVGFVLSRPFERAVMPIALALRSVPIVAMVPLLAYIFGRELVGSLVIVSIIVWFPALVLVSSGLRSVRPEALDLLRAYDAGPLTQLVKVRLPSAIPSLVASAKVCAPLAILGSLLNGWLSTGTGLGALMSLSTITAEFAKLWAAVVIVTVVSVLFAAVVTALEQVALARWAPDRVTR